MQRKMWVKTGKSEGWGAKKFGHLGKLAEQNCYYLDESYRKILQIKSADVASMCAGQVSTNIRLLKIPCLRNPYDVQRVKDMLSWSCISRLSNPKNDTISRILAEDMRTRDGKRRQEFHHRHKASSPRNK